ncbi:MAG: orotate phosphoribosyltransferase [Flavobacteriales bacterium]|nr:orotate phosphoribosyltransferase [Flavobacteriales bacterium]
MPSQLDPALKVAEFLLQIKAVKLSLKEPYTWASGWRSPIYCDNRKTLSYPAVRTFIRQQFVHVINSEFGRPDMIAGVATGGIAHGALVAHDMGLPFLYVRSDAKGHGMQNQVEGDLTVGRSVVLVEDLVSTGGSSLKAVEALRSEGCDVKGMVSIFTYGFDTAQKAFDDAKVKLCPLTNLTVLMEQALRSEYITEKDLPRLNAWMADPSNWGKTVQA